MPRRLPWVSPGRVSGVDTHDVGAFPTAAWRARILRIAFALAAVILVAAAAWSTRDLETQERGLLPSRTTGVVVIDLSLSITDNDYDTLRGVFRRLIEEDASIGLVVFSDVSYELLPPGTPASQLRPVLRLLVPPRLGQPVNPWTQTFRAGTQISSALQLARTMLERDGVHDGSILLVSDLETAPDDVPALDASHRRSEAERHRAARPRARAVVGRPASLRRHSDQGCVRRSGTRSRRDGDRE